MAGISPKRRRALPKEKFALPAKRKYPVDTKARAANAKARAKQQLDKGNLSPGAYKKVVTAANKRLRKKK